MESSKLKWWHVRWKRPALLLLTLLGIASALVIVTLLSIYEFMPWYFAIKAAHDTRNLDVTPQALPDRGIAPLDGSMIKQFDFSFQVPWGDVLFEKDWKNISIVSFKVGVAMLVLNPEGETNSVAIFRGDTLQDAELARRIYGTHALSSNYDLLTAELTAKPADVHWWTTRERNVRSMVLLEMKGLELGGEGENAIYWQGNAEMHGFQFGNPAAAPFGVKLVLFDRTDRRYQISLRGTNPAHQFVTQAEVNAIIASMKPIPYPAQVRP